MNVFQKDSSQSPEFQHIGYMREDDTGKVYFLQDGTEYWLYDFGMEVGDSIMNEWSNSYIRLDSITENEIGGTLRKCYHTSIYDDEMDYWFPSSDWVEGIGSLNGLLNVPEPPAPGGWISTLLCYKEYGEVIYMDEDFNDCEYTSTEENDITGNTLRVFPNPGEDILNIYTSLQNASIEVYDILGKVVYKQDITENITSIPTERWNSGMYLWKVYSEGNVVESGKWIKQ